MSTLHNAWSTRARGLIGAIVAPAVLLVSVGWGAPVASASSVRSATSSAFCTTMFTYQPTAVPSSKYLRTYKTWARSLIPFYEQLASEAPNTATKSVLHEVVVVLKHYVSSTSRAKLDARIHKYRAQWLAGAKALTLAIESCAKTLQ